MSTTYIFDPALQHVFEYFTERTPRSHFDFEERETSLVWNYKYAGACLNCSYCRLIFWFSSYLSMQLLILTFQIDVEFGKLQARDMLQHLWTGPISNSSVEVVQGSRSVEVRAVGVTKVI